MERRHRTEVRVPALLAPSGEWVTQFPNVPCACDLEVILWYYHQGVAFPRQSETYIRAHNRWTHFGLLVGDHHGGFDITDKGRVFVDMLLATPMPVQQWVPPTR